MEFDRALLSEKDLIEITNCIENQGYDPQDFRFSTQRVHAYRDGKLDPKAIIYVCRLSTGVEISYYLGGEGELVSDLCIDLQIGEFEGKSQE